MPVITAAHEGHKLELASEVLRSSGAIRLRALGTSMLPTIWPGDVLSIEPKATAEIFPGDVVLVTHDNRFFVHRLIEKRNSGWITRGDSMPQNDEPVAEAQLLGKVALIQRKTGGTVPMPLSGFSRALAWTFCHSDLLRNIALRIHDILVAPPSRRLSALRSGLESES